MGPGVLRNRGGVVNKNRVLIYINSFFSSLFLLWFRAHARFYFHTKFMFLQGSIYLN